MRAFFDCRAGVSGDMTLGALCHLGVELAPLEALLRAAGIDCAIRARQESRAAGPGRCVDVAWQNPQPLRHPADIRAIFHAVKVADGVRQTALAALDALTRAEAHAHQIPVEQVHFHEVGAIDTLVDILGAAWGLHELGVSRVAVSPLPWFSGTVECAHGTLPLPAPATAWLMQDKPVFPSGATTELITPTGAALMHALAHEFIDGPEGVVRGMGTGYGSRPAPAGLRVWLLEDAPCRPGDDAPQGATEEITLLESHLDHLSGEELGAALEELSALPHVLDVLWLPGVTKKNRPGGCLRVLCAPPHAESALAAFFRHTHTLGVRCQRVQRRILPRRAEMRKTPLGTVPAKAYDLDGTTFVRPEADALRRMARDAGMGMPGVLRADQE